MNFINLKAENYWKETKWIWPYLCIMKINIQNWTLQLSINLTSVSNNYHIWPFQCECPRVRHKQSSKSTFCIMSSIYIVQYIHSTVVRLLPGTKLGDSGHFGQNSATMRGRLTPLYPLTMTFCLSIIVENRWYCYYKYYWCSKRFYSIFRMKEKSLRLWIVLKLTQLLFGGVINIDREFTSFRNIFCRNTFKNISIMQFYLLLYFNKTSPLKITIRMLENLIKIHYI